MGKYVDGYLLPVPKKNVAAYKKMAQLGAKTWMKHGALSYVEAVGEDLNVKWGLPFPKGMKLKKGETVVFAFITYKSRAHRDKVNAAVMKEMQQSGMSMEMPFDMKRMMMGGFQVMVEG